MVLEGCAEHKHNSQKIMALAIVRSAQCQIANGATYMADIITSQQNQWVKEVKSLQSRARLRRSERKIVLEGTRIVNDALSQRGKPLYALYHPESADYDLIARLQDMKVRLLAVSSEVSKAMSDTQQPQGIIAVFAIPMPRLPKSTQRLLILDAIQEPGNMGTILRTAAAADVQLVILGPGSVDPYNPKVLRSGMGAHFRVPIVEAQWGEIAGYSEGLQVYVATGRAEATYTAVDWRQAWALVIGNEAHGVSQQAAKLPGQAIRIPLAAHTESLNAAVAAGVILFEAQRQRSSSS
jgi:RNA methyltransferase, TrmH family